MKLQKLLVLKLDGDCDRGFDIDWEIGDDGQRATKNGTSRLALLPAPELKRACKKWDRSSRGNRIIPIDNSITNVQYTTLLAESQEIADQLANLVDDWLERSPLSRLIQQDLLPNHDDEYRIVICTEDPLARKIPWLLWQGWQQFHHLQISLGAPYTQRHDRIYQQQVRILAILGDNTGIDIEEDRQILKSYESEGADVKFLAQPTIEKLREQLRDERGWDILSFSGHSRTEKANYGRIMLNPTDSLTMGELKTELKMAIDRSLQIAIFNSCDGLGIAAELEDLHIPQVIVMRQPVPDLVAQTFLKDFLAEFSHGTSLYQSVRRAQDRLKELESEYPCASWLPTIIQNHLETPPTWQSLGSIPKYPYRDLAEKNTQDRGMSRQELTEAIVSPAKKLNIQFEDGLIDTILDTVASSQNQWGLIEFILRPLWEQQENGQLTHRGYQEIGGVEQILASHAATIYDKLTLNLQIAFQNIFIQLIQFDRQTPIRRLANKAEIGENNWQLVELLSVERLVIINSQSDTIELIHESLIDHWKTFREWIENNRDFRHWQEQLRATISQWGKNNYDKGGLLQGRALIIATEKISSKYSSQVSSLEKDFIDRSLTKQRRDERIKIRVYFGIVIVMLLFLIQVNEKEQLATKSNISSLRQNAELLFKTQQSMALTKAEESVNEIVNSRLTDNETTLPAILTLSDILDRIDEKKVWSGQHINTITGAAYTQDGKNIISIDRDSRLSVYDLGGNQTQESLVVNSDSFFKLIPFNSGRNIITNRTLNTLKSWQQLADSKWSGKSKLDSTTEITAMALSPDSKTLAVAINGKQLRLYSDFLDNPNHHQDLTTSDDINDLKFTPDGQKIVTANVGSVQILTKQGELLNSYSSDSKRKFRSVAVHSHGKFIAAGDNRGVVTLLNIDGKIQREHTVDKQEILNLSFHPTQDLIAIATEDSQIKLWNINGEEPKLLSGHTENVQSVDFSPDGKTLISASADRTIRFWNIPHNFHASDRDKTSNHGINSDRSNFNEIKAFNYSINGDLLVLARLDRTIEIINPQDSKTLRNFYTKNPKIITEISISKDLKYIAASDLGDKVNLWTIEGKIIKTLDGSHCTFSPTGSTLAVAAKDKVGIYNINGKLIIDWNTGFMPSYLSFTPDGSSLIIADNDGNIRSWDMNGKLLSTFRNQDKNEKQLDNRILDISYSPDGKNIAIASNNPAQGQASIWLANGKQQILNSLVQITSLSFSPDGKVLLTGNKNGELQLWNLQGVLLKTIKYSRHEISTVRFRPNSARFRPNSLEFIAIEGGEGHKMRIYNLDANQLLDRARQWQQLTK
jgi:WD40 repeat protein